MLGNHHLDFHLLTTLFQLHLGSSHCRTWSAVVADGTRQASTHHAFAAVDVIKARATQCEIDSGGLGGRHKLFLCKCISDQKRQK